MRLLPCCSLRSWTPLALSLALLAGCAVVVHDGDRERDRGPKEKTLTARIDGRSGSPMSGKARFTARKGGVLIEITVRDAGPGWHAVHIHETGDCSAEDGTSAGGHFNPDGHDHGSPHAPQHHAGDLGNMWVDEDGSGHHAIFMPELSLESGPRAVAGRAIIVHAAIDDLTTQPTGAAGGRIGCGVIR